jgi:hypothetical protein
MCGHAAAIVRGTVAPEFVDSERWNNGEHALDNIRAKVLVTPADIK